MLKPTYHCTQGQLYTIATLGWNNCLNHLPAFAQFSGIYTNQFILDNLALIQTTAGIPSIYLRTSQAKILRIQLSQLSRQACILYQHLKRYIIASFPANHQSVMISSAGHQHFAAAYNNDWESTEELLNHVQAFIITHTTILQSNAGMPPDFITKVTAAKSNFFIVHQSFLNHEKNQKIDTVQKITANNLLYAILIKMFRDGYEIFRDIPHIRSLFTFSHCLYLIHGAGIAGIRGTVSHSSTGQPIPGVTIQVGVDNYSTITDNEGYYLISPAAAGTYSLTVSATGFQPFTIPAHVILTGTISTLNLLLNPEV